MLIIVFHFYFVRKLNTVLIVDNDTLFMLMRTMFLLSPLYFFDETYFRVKCSFSLSLINVFLGQLHLNLILFFSAVTSINFLECIIIRALDSVTLNLLMSELLSQTHFFKSSNYEATFWYLTLSTNAFLKFFSTDIIFTITIT